MVKFMVKYTSFPEVIKLSGHESWNYQNADNGKACSEPEMLYTKGIFRLISNYVEENEHYKNDDRNNFYDDFDIYQNLERLEGIIVGTLRQNFMEDVQANFFLEKIDEIRDYGYAYRSYAVIKVFCEIFNLDWFVLQ